MELFFPNSLWESILKLNLGIFPIFLISLFEFSSLPIGTSSNAIFGIELKIKSIFFFIFICSFEIFSIFVDNSLDFANLVLSCF